jgi:hypothetical protein
VLRIIFGPKREEVVGGWKRLHNEVLLNLYASLNIIRAIKLRKIRWMEQVMILYQQIGITHHI